MPAHGADLYHAHPGTRRCDIGAGTEGAATAHLGLSEDLRAAALISLGIAEVWAFRFEDAERHLEQGVALARLIGRPYLEFTGLTHGAHKPGGHRILVMRSHLLAVDHGVMDPAPAPYMIRINGHLGATMLSAFPAMTPHHHGAHTVLTGMLDRSALYGVLAEIDALGLDLLEVRQLTQARESPESGDSRSP